VPELPNQLAPEHGLKLPAGRRSTDFGCLALAGVARDGRGRHRTSRGKPETIDEMQSAVVRLTITLDVFTPLER
jgi:hypothetical protein